MSQWGSMASMRIFIHSLYGSINWTWSQIYSKISTPCLPFKLNYFRILQISYPLLGNEPPSPNEKMVEHYNLNPYGPPQKHNGLNSRIRNPNPQSTTNGRPLQVQNPPSNNIMAAHLKFVTHPPPLSKHNDPESYF
jgi:hypothetical protein